MNFTGMEGLVSCSTYSWDVTLELYFAQNRFYDAQDKRFTQEDKTEDGVNWYLYVENAPLIFIDADGNRMAMVENCGVSMKARREKSNLRSGRSKKAMIQAR